MMDFLHLTKDCLSVDEVLKLVSNEKCGAVSMFVGTTRDNFEGREVMKLEYEAYESMAVKVMKSICSTVREKWKEVHHIAIHHRLGTVPVMEASVIIAISSPHRIDSIAAVQYCIENLKVHGIFEKEIPESSNASEIKLDPHTVQITASRDEILNRIKKYTDRKREQINIGNIKDFINRDITDEDLINEEISSCARVDAVLLKSKDSKGHLRVMRTHNEWGPQTKVDVPKLTVSQLERDVCGTSSGIEERIVDVEKRLNVSKPISSDVYSRLKRIEDRITELESISPEYSIFWSGKIKRRDDADDNEPSRKKLKFSSDDIWKHLKELEKR